MNANETLPQRLGFSHMYVNVPNRENKERVDTADHQRAVRSEIYPP